MKRFIALLLMMPSLATAQIRRPPCDVWCQIFGTPPKPFERVAPLPRLNIPRRVGVVALADDGGFNGLWHNSDGWPNWVAADEAVGYGISAIQLWPMVSLIDEDGWWPSDGHMDMTWVFDNPGIDLLVIRPMQHSFSEVACDGQRSAVWEGGDWGEYAEQLYEKYGDIPKTVILLNWEGDWQLWGSRCRELNECSTGDIWPSYWHEEYAVCDGDYDCQVGVCENVRRDRAWYMRHIFEQRKAGIDAARAAHPDAALTVLFGITVNHTEDTEQINLTRDVLPFMDLEGVVIALSHWDNDQSIVEALEYIRSHLHHPRYNMIVAELGAKKGSSQADAIYAKADAALAWGAQAVFVWDWHSDDYGVVDMDGIAGPGMSAIDALREKYE